MRYRMSPTTSVPSAPKLSCPLISRAVSQLALSRSEYRSLGVHPVAQLPQRGDEGELLLWIKDPLQQLSELAPVELERLAHPLAAGLGQRGESAPAVLWDRLDGSRDPPRTGGLWLA